MKWWAATGMLFTPAELVRYKSNLCKKIIDFIQLIEKPN